LFYIIKQIIATTQKMNLYLLIFMLIFAESCICADLTLEEEYNIVKSYYSDVGDNCNRNTIGCSKGHIVRV